MSDRQQVLTVLDELQNYAFVKHNSLYGKIYNYLTTNSFANEVVAIMRFSSLGFKEACYFNIDLVANSL